MNRLNQTGPRLNREQCHFPAAACVSPLAAEPVGAPAGTVWFTPQQIDELRLQRDSELMAAGESVGRTGCPLGEVNFSDSGRRTPRRNLNS